MQYKNPEQKMTDTINCPICPNIFTYENIVSHLQSCLIENEAEWVNNDDRFKDYKILRQLLVKFLESQELKDFTNINELKQYILPFLNEASDIEGCTFSIINYLFKGEDVDTYRFSLLNKTN